MSFIMDTVEVFFNLAEKALHDMKEVLEMNLYLASDSMFCGSVSLKAGKETMKCFPTQLKSDGNLKRKPVNMNGTVPAKKPKAPAVSSPVAKSNSVPPGATMGSVTPNFGTMPDGRIICPVCTAILKDMQKAKRHFESAHSGIVYKCEICGNENNRKDHLKEHLMKKHQLASDIAKVMADRSQKQ